MPKVGKDKTGSGKFVYEVPERNLGLKKQGKVAKKNARRS